MAHYSTYAPELRPKTDKPVTGPRQTKRVLLTLGYGLSAGLTVLLLLMQARLAVLSQETADLERQREALLQTQTRLQIAHASAFSPQRLDAYALDAGMVKPKGQQYAYIEIGLPEAP